MDSTAVERGSASFTSGLTSRSDESDTMLRSLLRNFERRASMQRY
jgi:hypothetical protein